jgi:hypothetical protein
MTRRSDTDAALQAIYDRIPDMAECKGHCWASCGPVPMSDRERQRLRERGYKVTDCSTARASIEEFWCEALTGDGRCGAYDVRPALCRAWGTAAGMPCPYGCRPESLLSDEDTFRLTLEAYAAGGGQGDGMEIRAEDIPALMEGWHRRRPQMEAFQRRGQMGTELRVARHGETPPPEVTRRKKLKRS